MSDMYQNAKRNLSTYSEGEAAGILQALQVLRPNLVKGNLKNTYITLLIQIGKTAEDAQMWADYFMPEETQS